MAGNFPNKFVFGPYCLKTYPPKQAFKTQFPLFFEQHCLVDNLFNQPKTAQYNDILHTLVEHLANLNCQIENLRTQSPLKTSEPILPPLWHKNEKLLVTENKKKSTRVFELEKDLEVLGKKLTEKTEELNLLKKEWEKEWRLAHILQQIFKSDLACNGYINLEFESIPSSLKFPDAAIHIILITTHEFKQQEQHLLMDSFSLLEGEVEDHYTLARVFLQASQPVILHVPRYDFQLLA